MQVGQAQPSATSPAVVDGIFRALSDPTRRRVLERLGRESASVSELAAEHSMALPSFIEHLKMLKGAGLVRSSKTGRVRTYELTPDRLRLAEDWLGRQRSAWEGRLNRLDAYLLLRKQENRMSSPLTKPDPNLDLVLEREIDVPLELVWNAWTTPESIKHWFVPKPWTVTACEIDLRPGGAFNTTMRSPDGDEFANAGCYLEVVRHERLIFTDALLPGFRPAPKPFFTAGLFLERTATGTRYTAIAVHGHEARRRQHEEMGFHDGWSTVVDQMVAHIKSSMH